MTNIGVLIETLCYHGLLEENRHFPRSANQESLLVVHFFLFSPGRRLRNTTFSSLAHGNHSLINPALDDQLERVKPSCFL